METDLSAFLEATERNNTHCCTALKTSKGPIFIIRLQICSQNFGQEQYIIYRHLYSYLNEAITSSANNNGCLLCIRFLR